MKYLPNKKQIIIDKELNELDKFVLDFVEFLPEYVLVSGYVSILTGRSRATEDVDLLIPKMNFEKFKQIWDKINERFECINTSDAKEAFNMLKEHAIRFARKHKAIPNMEFKIISNEIQNYSFTNRIKVLIGPNFLFISPLEMQIAYKLYLGSEKDLEDAKHLYELFKDKIDFEELENLLKDFKIKEKLNLIK